MIRIPTLYTDLSASMEILRREHPAVDRSREVVLNALADGKAHYGINTGFGILADKRIGDDQLVVLQHNLLLSHACGVGDPIPLPITRLMLQLKIHALGLGQSGISRSTFKQLLSFEQQGITSWVPSRGSVGASGDLAPPGPHVPASDGLWSGLGRIRDPASSRTRENERTEYEAR